MKSLGTTVRSRFQIVALLSHSRCSAPAISTGCTSLLNTLAKVPLTRPSRRCSKRFSTPTGHLPPRDLPAGPFPILLTDRIHAREKELVPRSRCSGQCQHSQSATTPPAPPVPPTHWDG